MTKEEILHLGNLSRMRLSEKEAEKFLVEIDAILNYVGEVKEIVSETDASPAPGVVRNVFREDVVTNEPGSSSKDLIEAFPEKRGNYLKVKKILNPDS
ncbi:MAG: Asp-tRNA(Asn)/Glu-tRNA(Gln) amidotransferase subunit GatC [Candidatus Paceibacterota bacterium]